MLTTKINNVKLIIEGCDIATLNYRKGEKQNGVYKIEK